MVNLGDEPAQVADGLLPDGAGRPRERSDRRRRLDPRRDRRLVRLGLTGRLPRQQEEALSLRLPGHWIWDFWFAADGGDVHVFFLHAPRDLGHPDLRHSHAQIGHAVSRDLRKLGGPAHRPQPGPARRLRRPGPPGPAASWRPDGRWRAFLRGISTRDGGRVQRVGLATSEDLRTTWERQPLVLEADPRWYETARDHPRGDARPRASPWGASGTPADGRFHMVVCARVNHGPPDGRGVLGHASSADLRTWEAGACRSRPRASSASWRCRSWSTWAAPGGPCSPPGGPDRGAARLAPARRGRPEGGTHYLDAPGPLGSLRPGPGQPSCSATPGSASTPYELLRDARTEQG